jgi:hypothetical protein
MKNEISEIKHSRLLSSARILLRKADVLPWSYHLLLTDFRECREQGAISAKIAVFFFMPNGRYNKVTHVNHQTSKI